MDYSLLFIKARNPDYNSQKILEELKEESGNSKMPISQGTPRTQNAIPQLLRMPALVYVKSK
jgi:hypothetical protein